MRSQFSKLTIDDQDYFLGYDFNDLVDAEDVARCNLLSAVDRQGNNSAAEMRGLLYALIRDKDEGLGIRQVGRLIRVDTIKPIMFAMAEACAMAVSEEYVEKWRQAMEEESPEFKASVEGSADSESQEPPTDEHLLPESVEAYRAGGPGFTEKEHRHVLKCPACFEMLNSANKERLMAI